MFNFNAKCKEFFWLNKNLIFCEIQNSTHGVFNLSALDRKRKFDYWKCKKNTSIKILKQNIRYYSYDQSSISDNQHTFSEKKYRVYLHIVYICIMRCSFFSLLFINLTIHEVTA